MPNTTELEPALQAETATTAIVTDRRRPGRIQNVSPDLIPILRGQEPSLDFEPGDADQTAPLRGVAFGVLLSLPAWAAIAYAGSVILTR